MKVEGKCHANYVGINIVMCYQTNEINYEGHSKRDEPEV